MTDAKPGDKQDPCPGDSEPESAALARDWIALWQSELAAMANDRELHEAWTQLLGLWAGFAGNLIAAGQAVARHDPNASPSATPAGRAPTRRASANGASRAKTGTTAPDAGGDAVEHLHHRIAELETRLAAVERNDKSKRSRIQRSRPERSNRPG